MRTLTPAFMTLALVVSTVGYARTWRPPYLDLDDEVIKVGPTKVSELLGSDPDEEVITHLSLSPNGNYAALVMRNGRSLVLQVVNLVIRGNQTRLVLGEAERADESRYIQWAPDSRSLMITESRGWASGEIGVASLPFDKLTTLRLDGSWEDPTFSPDGRLIAYRCHGCTGNGEEETPGIYYLDLATNEAVFWGDLPVRGQIVGWTRDNRIQIVSERGVDDDERGGRRRRFPRFELIELSLVDHSRSGHPIPWEDPRGVSPDGRYYFEFGGVWIYEVGTRRAVRLSGDDGIRPLQWGPQGRFVVAWRSDPVKDDLGRVHRERASVWLLRAPREGADDALGRSQDRQLLALADVAIGQGPGEPMAAMTSDGKKLVYVADNQLRAKELKSLTGEQAAAVRRQYEQALQAEALGNAKQIAAAFMMYADDQEGLLPDPEEDVIEAIRDYVKASSTIFESPHLPGVNCFEYHPPQYRRIGGRPDEAMIALGWLDWGRGWLVFLYADGHCELVERKKG